MQEETSILHLLEEHSPFLFVLAAILMLALVLLTAAWFARRAERGVPKGKKRNGTE